MLAEKGTWALGLWHRWLFGCILITAMGLLVSGCWDQHDVEDRRFVLAIAIDRADQGLGPEQGKDVAQTETFMQPHGSKSYRLSLQLMDITPAKSGGTAGPLGELTTYVISNTGESMLEMIRDMLGQVDKTLWFEDIQIIVISEAAIRQGGLKPIIDFFRRDREMRWLTKTLITSGEARPFLEYQLPSGEPSGMFMANSLRQYVKNTHIPTWRTDIGDIARSMDNKSRVLMARVELVDHVIKLGGMAFFKKGKFVGYVDEYATKGGKFILGTAKSAIITVECPEHPGKVIAFELFSYNKKLTPHVDGDTIYYTLDLAMKGNLGEMQCAHQHDTMDVNEIHRIEELVAEEIKRNVLYSLHNAQDLKVDGIVLGAKLKAHEPLVWEKVKEHWDDEVFPNISMVVSVNVVIENIGAHQ